MYTLMSVLKVPLVIIFENNCTFKNVAAAAAPAERSEAGLVSASVPERASMAERARVEKQNCERR